MIRQHVRQLAHVFNCIFVLVMTAFGVPSSVLVSLMPSVEAALTRFPLLRLVSTGGSAIGIYGNSLHI